MVPISLTVLFVFLKFPLPFYYMFLFWYQIKALRLQLVVSHLVVKRFFFHDPAKWLKGSHHQETVQLDSQCILMDMPGLICNVNKTSMSNVWVSRKVVMHFNHTRVSTHILYNCNLETGSSTSCSCPPTPPQTFHFFSGYKQRPIQIPSICFDLHRRKRTIQKEAQLVVYFHHSLQTCFNHWKFIFLFGLLRCLQALPVHFKAHTYSNVSSQPHRLETCF